MTNQQKFQPDSERQAFFCCQPFFNSLLIEMSGSLDNEVIAHASKIKMMREDSSDDA